MCISKEQQSQRRNYPSHRTYEPSTLLHQVQWDSSCIKPSFPGLPFFQHFATAEKLLLLNSDDFTKSRPKASWKATSTLWKPRPVSGLSYQHMLTQLSLVRSRTASANPEDSGCTFSNVLPPLSLLQLLAPGSQDHRTVAAKVLDVLKFLSLVFATFGLEGV